MAGSLPDHQHHTPTMLGDFGKDLTLPEPHPTISRTQHHQHQLDDKGGILVSTEAQEECPEPSAIAKSIKRATPSAAKNIKRVTGAEG